MTLRLLNIERMLQLGLTRMAGVLEGQSELRRRAGLW